MEFLLINHPLDCPICDQGGECDLQDQSVAYGRGGSRFDENKRAVEEKFMGPLVKTVMTRCIQCTRCIRFATEVAGVPELGATGRGEDMEVTTYLEASLTSELSANVIDLCPVGALTSKPYAFNARPWELTKTETIDVMDALGSNIRVDARGDAVLRVLPRVNEEINEEWISDKTRYAEDGLSRQRLDRPYIRENGKLRAASWDEALGRDGEGAFGRRQEDRRHRRRSRLRREHEGDARSFPRARLAQHRLPRRTARRSAAARAKAISSTPPSPASTKPTRSCSIGTNPRIEAPVLNARIRKAWLRGAEIGVDRRSGRSHVSSTSTSAPARIAERARRVRRHAEERAAADGDRRRGRARARGRRRGAARSSASSPAGDSCATAGTASTCCTRRPRASAASISASCRAGRQERARDARRAAWTRCCCSASTKWRCRSAARSSIIGTHGDTGAHRADIILPGAAYTEKDATWVNTEGRVQYGRRATFPKGEAKEDWTILRALSA